MTAPAVEVSGLVKRYGDRTAVDGLSFTAGAGRVLALLGPNGAGKTTTVEVCEGYRHADAGAVRVLGLDPVRDATALRPRVGVMLQSGGAYPGARVAEMLRLLASYAADPLDPELLLARLGLLPVARTPWRRLSGGEKQRLALAMAVVGRPEVVFLDEPTAGLDPHARRDTWELVSALRSDGVAVVLTTHHMEEAERLADDVVIVDAGRVVATGTPEELTRGGADRQLRFRAASGLDLTTLMLALPADAKAREVTPGQYLVEGDVTAQLLATVTAWCAGFGVLAQDLKIERRSLEDVFLDVTARREP